MIKCECYEVTTQNRGIVECRCNGTKEREICTCGGDKSKCNFYNLTKSMTNEEIMDAVTFLKEKKRMCEYEGGEGRSCAHCPIYENLLEGFEACDDADERHPEEVVKLVQKWSHENPILPTWNEWLHYIYSYYHGFNNSLGFMDWLNTRITQEEADHWNIPDRKDIIK